MKDNTTVSGCTDRQGNERKEGEIWMTNKCTECVCEVETSSFEHFFPS